MTHDRPGSDIDLLKWFCCIDLPLRILFGLEGQMTKQEALKIVEAADLIRSDQEGLNYEEIAELLVKAHLTGRIEVLGEVAEKLRELSRL